MNPNLNKLKKRRREAIRRLNEQYDDLVRVYEKGPQSNGDQKLLVRVAALGVMDVFIWEITNRRKLDRGEENQDPGFLKLRSSLTGSEIEQEYTLTKISILIPKLLRVVKKGIKYEDDQSASMLILPYAIEETIEYWCKR